MLGALAAGAALDPDFLKWEPGARTYFDMGAGRDWTVMTFRRGDIIEIAGRVALNPVTMQPTERLAKFVVMADVRADHPAAVLDVWPRYAGYRGGSGYQPVRARAIDVTPIGTNLSSSQPTSVRVL